MAAAHVLHLRHLLCTFRLRIRTSRVEPAAGRRIDRTRDITLDAALYLLSCELRVRDRNTAEQSLRIGMQWMLVDLICLRELDELS